MCTKFNDSPGVSNEKLKIDEENTGQSSSPIELDNLNVFLH
jgi:hypothetical protein